MGDATVSNIYAQAAPAASARQTPVLAIVMCAGDLAMAPSRHVLDDIDVIAFGRGPRAARRDTHANLKRLVIELPDPVMSTDHGRLVRVQGKWLVDDPRSKNGTLVAGKPVRTGLVRPGDVLELGHTAMLLATADLEAGSPPDALGQPRGSLHPALAAAAADLAAIAGSDVCVSIHGETGTGKEVYARALHAASGRPGAFVAVNCGALAPSLLEAELFGHKRGAFSGATADREGFVRAADRGTLFLDEIAELSPAGQVALLRVLQEREVIAVGDTVPVAVDLRVYAATQRPLADVVAAGAFRADLHARLLGYELALPPLRARKTDLGELCRSLAERAGWQLQLTPAAARGLICHDWPLNIRELERVLGTALALARGGPVDLPHLPVALRDAARRGRSEQPLEGDAPLPERSGAAVIADDDPLRAQLAAKLVEHRGNISAVARDLGKHREQIQRWLRRFALDPDAFR